MRRTIPAAIAALLILGTAASLAADAEPSPSAGPAASPKSAESPSGAAVELV